MKRFLSIFLALTMILAMLPTVFAADTAAAPIEYVFTRTALGSPSENVQRAALATITLADTFTDSELWRAAGGTRLYNLYSDKDGIFIVADKSRVDGGKSALIIEFSAKEEGVYIPVVDFKRYTNAPIADIYLVEESTTSTDGTTVYTTSQFELPTGTGSNANVLNYVTYLSGDYKRKTVDMYGEGTGTESLGSYTFSKDKKYYLILHLIGTNAGYDTSKSRTYSNIHSLTLTPAATQEDVASAFELDGSKETNHSASINPLFATTDGSKISASVSARDEDEDGIYIVTADATDESDEYKFLYWIKGLTSDAANKIVSLTATIEEYKPQNGANYLIAVYEKVGSETSKEPEFYNGNGQLLSDLTLGENGELPGLPSMAGYGSAKEWKKHNDFIYVAQYDDFTVRVNGNDVKYGDSVTFTADSSEGEFKWWTRTVNGVTEIVSLDETYTFCPWEDCTVEAEYGDEKQIMAGNRRKIILDVLGNDSVMAEFIGLDGSEVVEKGIILTNTEGEKKIAMSTNNSQFTITNNISATKATGYAIIKDGEAFTEITDGTIELN